jgi:hypothetical protein
MNNSAREIKYVIALHVGYPIFLKDSNETCTLPKDFRKILKCQISLQSAQWEPSCSLQTKTEQERDMTKLIAIRTFVNVPGLLKPLQVISTKKIGVQEYQTWHAYSVSFNDGPKIRQDVQNEYN